jgi:hypothetical protein
MLSKERICDSLRVTALSVRFFAGGLGFLRLRWSNQAVPFNESFGFDQMPEDKPHYPEA